MDIEEQFILNVAREANRVNSNITNESGSKHGLKKQLSPELVRYLKQQQAKFNTDGGYNPPSVDDVTIEPIQITPDMIREIQEFGEDFLLPEMKKKQQLLGNEFVKPNVGGNIPPQQCYDDKNQLELDFSRVMKVDDVHDLVVELKAEFKKDIKELKKLLNDALGNG